MISGTYGERMITSLLLLIPGQLIKNNLQAVATVFLLGTEGKEISMDFDLQAVNECLDWQPSQFINIVGKDDATKSGSGEGGGVAADSRHSLPVVREAQPNRFLPSHSEIFYKRDNFYGSSVIILHELLTGLVFVVKFHTLFYYCRFICQLIMPTVICCDSQLNICQPDVC